jgi:outer membrane lipoprotein-sorting protein
VEPYSTRMAKIFSPRIFRAAALAAASLGVPLALAPLAAAPEAARKAQPNDLDQVQRHIRSVTTLTAAFAQTDRKGQVQTGKLLWKQPGHIRFQYEGGVPMLIVADGKSLTLIDYEVRQVERWPIRNSPLGALLDPKRDVMRYGTLIQTGDPRVVSVDVRDPKHPEYGVINLVFQRDAQAPAGLRLYGWVAKDAQGNRTSIRLTNHAYGAAIPNSAFRWTDPRLNMKGPMR